MSAQLSSARTTRMPFTNVEMRLPSCEMSGRSPMPMPSHVVTLVCGRTGPSLFR
jgi:hypothetical protein